MILRWVLACLVAAGVSRLFANDLSLVTRGEQPLPIVRLIDGKMFAEREGELVEVASDVALDIRGDLSAAIDRVYWQPSFSFAVASEKQRRRDPSPFRGTARIDHVAEFADTGERYPGSLLGIWPDALDLDGLLLFVWIREGKTVGVKASLVKAGGIPDYFRFSEEFGLDADGTPGSVVALCWQNGRFLPISERGAEQLASHSRKLVASGSLADLAQLVSRIGGVDAPVDGTGNRLIHYASQVGSIGSIEYLLSLNAQVDQVNGQRRTALHEASEKGRVEIVQRLLKASARANASDIDGLTPLHLASIGGHRGIVDLLIGAKADIAERPANRSVDAFSLALERGHTGVAQLLLERGYRFDFKNDSSARGLIAVAARGNPSVVELFLEKGARIVRDDRGRTALGAAAEAGDARSVQALLSAEKAAKVSVFDPGSALRVASSRGYIDCVRVLLDAGTSADHADENGNTALHLAAAANRTDIIEELLRRGASLKVLNKAKYSALGFAARMDSREAMRVLLKAEPEFDWGQPLAAIILDAVVRLDLAEELSAALGWGVSASYEVRRGWPLSELARLYRATNCTKVLGPRLHAGSATVGQFEDVTQVEARPLKLSGNMPLDPRPIGEDYPEEVVEVEVLIGLEGEPLFPRVADSSDHRLSIVAKDAVSRWKFSPGKRGEVPTRVRMSVPVIFPSSMDRIVELMDLESVPKILHQVVPQFPPDLRLQGRTGEVTVQFVVNSRGRTEDIQVVSATDPGFSERTIAAVAQWRFSPGVKNGRPVNTRMRVPIVFDLKKK